VLIVEQKRIIRAPFRSSSAERGVKRASEPRNLVAKFYRAPDGSQPVDAFIEGLPAEVQVIVDAQITRINMLDETHNQLAFPHSSQVRGSLRELRCHYGNTLYRILYRQSGHFVILLHMIRKNSAAIPSGDIAVAEQRWADFQARINVVPVRPPRAAGKDAPRKHFRP
jgi:phage-related protein